MVGVHVAGMDVLKVGWRRVVGCVGLCGAYVEPEVCVQGVCSWTAWMCASCVYAGWLRRGWKVCVGVVGVHVNGIGVLKGCVRLGAVQRVGVGGWVDGVKVVVAYVSHTHSHPSTLLAGARGGDGGGGACPARRRPHPLLPFQISLSMSHKSVPPSPTQPPQH